MNKTLFLLFSIFFFFTLVRSDVGDGPCDRTSTVLIQNVATGMYLSIERRIVVLSHIEQIWCLNDESSILDQVFRNPGRNQRRKVVIYCGNSDYVLNLSTSSLDNAVLDVLNTSEDPGRAAEWKIVYNGSSQKYSIQTSIRNSVAYSLSAVSEDPTEGVTLRPFDATNRLQQWNFIAQDY